MSKETLKSKDCTLIEVYWKNLKWFQPENIKVQSKLEKRKLKKSIVDDNFALPFVIWDRGAQGQFILDGHHREMALKELEKEGVDIPELMPALSYKLKNEAEAKKLVLMLNARFSTIKKDLFADWVKSDFKDFENVLTNLNFKQYRPTDFFASENNLETKSIEDKLNDLTDPQIPSNPIPYYGGKSKLFKTVLMHFPHHNHYIEPFVGGGAVFWKKKNAFINSINDKSKITSNLYYVMKDPKLFKKFQDSLSRLCFSEVFYKDYLALIKENENKNILSFNSEDRINLALGFWYTLTTSFSAVYNQGLGYEKKSTSQASPPFFNKSEMLRGSDYFCQKLKDVQIFCRDAVELIKLLDTPESFYYIDPPYFNARMNFYRGYTEKDFEELLKALSNIEGKFLLSCYDSDILQKYAQSKKWNTKEYDYALTAYNRNDTDELFTKTELLVYNYQKEDFILGS